MLDLTRNNKCGTYQQTYHFPLCQVESLAHQKDVQIVYYEHCCQRHLLELHT
jgi:hypothetical protein